MAITVHGRATGNIGGTSGVTGGGTIACQTCDSRFWTRDGTSAPPTADWNMGNYGFYNMGFINMTDGRSIQSTTGQASIDFGANGLTYEAGLDGHFLIGNVMLDDFSGGGAGYVKHNAVGVLTSSGNDFIDISSETNLAVDAPIKLTGDTLSINSTLLNDQWLNTSTQVYTKEYMDVNITGGDLIMSQDFFTCYNRTSGGQMCSGYNSTIDAWRIFTR